MRLLSIGIVGGALLVALLVYLVAYQARPAHIAALVPADAEFAVLYSSINDLREVYEGPHARADVDPALFRIGRPINVPGFDGLSFQEPVGSWVRGGDEVFVLPVGDFDALEEAFETSRENLRVRAPEKVAKNYASISAARLRAKRGDDNRLVRRAVATYPVAAVGRPRNGDTLRRMLGLLLLRESPRPTQEGRPRLGHELVRMPKPIADAVADECDDLLIGVAKPRPPLALEVTIEASPRPGGFFDGADEIAKGETLAGLLRALPFNTALCLAAVMPETGWDAVGLPFRFGGGAVAAALIKEQGHARPFNLLIAVRPQDPKRLDGLARDGWRSLLDGPAEERPARVVADGDAEVFVREIDAPPAWLGVALRAHARKRPALFVATTTNRGVWLAAIGSLAEAQVRRMLGNRRKTPELGLRRLRYVDEHPGFLTGDHLMAAIVTAGGLQAFDYTMPQLELAAIATPAAGTVTGARKDGRLILDLRIHR